MPFSIREREARRLLSCFQQYISFRVIELLLSSELII